MSLRKRMPRRPRVSFVPDELSAAARELWPQRDAMPTPQAVAAILDATRSEPALRLELLSWLRRTAVPRGQELHSFVGMLIAIVAIGVSVTAANPIVSITVVIASLAGLFWLLALSTDVLIDLSERSRHSTAWLGAVEDAIDAERSRSRRWRRQR
jgi:hypothetical protein